MKKLYYTIGEVSEITDVEPHILRYWETKFDRLSPTKNSAGKRTYTDQHIELILKLKQLIQDEKYSTAGAKQALDEDPDSDDQQHIPYDLQRDLKEIKHFLNSMLNKL